ncbi:formin-like protein 3 isoform X2 [Actinia tenebrosa]|uniref:Formin-like protein 3 isoform X2 n=1 Tax=Actinia tenebrosa TaxID=6105 RepID=A0A6P8HT81_ACTTE|nr:formin-like protein 3 isoform X2 [Actinia tenebrosa]
MVQDRNSNVKTGHSNGIVMPGKMKNGVSKTSTRAFDSVRSNSSMLFSANSSGGEDTEFEVDDEMPDDIEIEERFSILLEKMALPAERAAELSKSPKSHKWKMIKAKESMQPKYSSGFYIEQLRGHREVAVNKHSATSKRLTKTLEPVEMVLRSLEVDLRTHPNTTWLREFIDDPYRGHTALIEFLQHLHVNPPPKDTPIPQELQSDLERTQTRSYGSTRSLKPEVFARSYIDEHLCLQSLRVLMKNKYGFQSVMSVNDSIMAILHCLKVNSRKTQALVLRMLIQICHEGDYYQQVIDAIRFYMKTSRESKPFETLVSLIYKKPISPSFQAICLNFLNTFINSAPSFNVKVFHQQEIENAGLDPDKIEQTLEGVEAKTVRDALKTWRDGYINVQSVMDEFVSLRERTKYLRDEVDLLQAKLGETEKSNGDLKKRNEELEASYEEYRLRTNELQTTLENLVKQVKSEAEAMEVPEDLINTLSEAAAAAAVPEAPEAPPPPPPPPPPTSGTDGVSPTNRKRLRHKSIRLPMLNWMPISNDSNGSIFKEVNDEDIISAMDFDEFDRRFELKTSDTSEEVQAKRENAVKRAAEQITILNSKRARNLVIARHRIKHKTDEIKELIDACDLVELTPEHAELLLKFVPTKEELAGFARYASEYDRMSEADQFMFKMAQVERYEAKLGVMAFIGVFEELMRTVVPEIDSVLRAATSIINSVKIKKLFKIILIYGNYMNSSRRGMALGFKLESLYKMEDTRTTDRKQTFLAYLVETVRRSFPDVCNFYEELHLEGATQVSIQTLAADVQGLRKGLDLTKSEKDKQPNNFVIFNFYNRAFRKVQRVTERFRKMEEAYSTVCAMFFEDPKIREPSEFFKTFVDFIALYKKAERELDQLNRHGYTAEDKMKRMLSRDYQSMASQAADEARRRSQYNGFDATIISI